MGSPAAAAVVGTMVGSARGGADAICSSGAARVGRRLQIYRRGRVERRGLDPRPSRQQPTI